MFTPRVVSILALIVGVAGAGAAERPLLLDLTRSRVEVVVKATVDSFTGRLTRYSPAVLVDEGGRIVSARLAFHFRDVATGKDKRDTAMHTWQQTETFPDGEFVLASLAPAPDGSYTASGRLTLHGVMRELQFPVTVLRDGGLLAIDGDATVDVREFGLPVIRMFGLLKVDPRVHVRFHLQGTPES